MYIHIHIYIYIYPVLKTYIFVFAKLAVKSHPQMMPCRLVNLEWESRVDSVVDSMERITSERI